MSRLAGPWHLRSSYLYDYSTSWFRPSLDQRRNATTKATNCSWSTVVHETHATLKGQGLVSLSIMTSLLFYQRVEKMNYQVWNPSENPMKLGSIQGGTPGTPIYHAFSSCGLELSMMRPLRASEALVCTPVETKKQLHDITCFKILRAYKHVGSSS